MNLEENQTFKYEDKSKNIFSKINFVNCLTLKEIQQLNEKYKELGLFIKQVRVDNFGNEKSKDDDLVLKKYTSKKRLLKTRSKMTLDQLYFKYFCIAPFSEKSKCLRSFDKILDDDELMDKIELEEIKNNLEDIHQDYEQLEPKRCKINSLEFKKDIIKYIPKFNRYLNENQYKEIYNKMKDKCLLEIADHSKIDDLSEWSVPLLKEFKAEIEIAAISNILEKKIVNEKKEEKEEDKNKNNEEEKEKFEKEKLDDSNSFSSVSF